MSSVLTLCAWAAGALGVPLGAVAARLDPDRWVGALALALGVHALVLCGTAVLVRRALARLDAALVAQDEELRLAALRRVRTAERDHELRNGLAGLAGAARLIGDERSDRDLLETLVATELDRLDGLLRSSDGVPPAGPATSYAVEPVLGGLAALRRAAGTDVHLEVDPALRATGSPDALAQVVTNLLANAERHAPGSPLRVTARARHGRVVVRVRDFGPGVRPGHEELVFEPGVRDRSRGGRGLGLDLCRRLLAREDGSIAIRQAEPSMPGCVVVVELPAPPVTAGADAGGTRAAEGGEDGSTRADDAGALSCGAP